MNHLSTKKISILTIAILITFGFYFFGSQDVNARGEGASAPPPAAGVNQGGNNNQNPVKDPDPHPSSCFLAGTKVLTTHGEKNIEDIQPGDIVLSYETDNLEQVLASVQKQYQVTRDHYYTITTEKDNQVKATDEHPFYVGLNGDQIDWSINTFITQQKIVLQDKMHNVDPDRAFPDQLVKGFKRTKDLSVGETVYIYQDGEIIKDKISTITKTFEQVQAYNLVLGGPNTYYANSFAVHNKGGNPDREMLGIAGAFCQDPGGPAIPLPNIKICMDGKSNYVNYGDYKWDCTQTAQNGFTPVIHIGDTKRDKGPQGVAFYNIPDLNSDGTIKSDLQLADGTPYSQMKLDQNRTFSGMAPVPGGHQCKPKGSTINVEAGETGCVINDYEWWPQDRCQVESADYLPMQRYIMCDAHREPKSNPVFYFTNCSGPQSAQSLMCVEQKPDKDSIEQGQPITLSCKVSGNINPKKVDMQVLDLANNNQVVKKQENIAVTNDTATWTENNLVPGNYKSQCRVCNDDKSKCTPWGKTDIVQ